VTTAKHPKHGGGRRVVGKAYVVHGRTYTPMPDPAGYVDTGEASWYGADFHGRLTANGEIFSANAITGAHPTLPLPSYARVTNLQNGRSLVVRVNDRGPYLPGRIMDLSYRAAEMLGYARNGTGEIRVQYVGPAPLEGDDTRMLVASLNRVTPVERQAETRIAEAPSVPVPATRRDSVATEVAAADIGRVNFADYTSAHAGTLGAFTDANPAGLPLAPFGYVDARAADREIADAHAAVDAVATRAAALDDWVATVDDDRRAIRLRLGTFTDLAAAQAVAESFALLGAVDEAEVRVPGADATRLTLTHLKPGVARSDVLALARELGLDGLALY
jgi:rare lipoprotein A